MFILPKGTVVKFKGLPFELMEDVATNGSEENYKLALSQSLATCSMPIQAESPDCSFVDDLDQEVENIPEEPEDDLEPTAEGVEIFIEFAQSAAKFQWANKPWFKKIEAHLREWVKQDPDTIVRYVNFYASDALSDISISRGMADASNYLANKMHKQERVARIRVEFKKGQFDG